MHTNVEQRVHRESAGHCFQHERAFTHARSFAANRLSMKGTRARENVCEYKLHCDDAIDERCAAAKPTRVIPYSTLLHIMYDCACRICTSVYCIAL